MRPVSFLGEAGRLTSLHTCPHSAVRYVRMYVVYLGDELGTVPHGMAWPVVRSGSAMAPRGLSDHSMFFYMFQLITCVRIGGRKRGPIRW